MNYSFSCEIHFLVQNQEKMYFYVSQKLLTEEITFWNDPYLSFARQLILLKLYLHDNRERKNIELSRH